MAGGIGSRFWPISRKNLPKQFIDVLGTGSTLIQQTYQRFEQIVPAENIFIITNKEYVEMVKTQIPTLWDSRIISEPAIRNTAPCVAYASFVLQSINRNANCVVAPSDHLITNETEFFKTINACFEYVAHNDALVTLGIKPTRPDTGYGYIQYNPGESAQGFCEVKTFTEKPSVEIAQTFIESGEFLWNAGIFSWNLQSVLKRFEMHLPEIYQLFSEIDFSKDANDIANIVEKAYGMCPSISLDYGIMEKDENVSVYPSSFGWNDLGTWKSLWDVSKKDVHDNVKVGSNIHFYDSKNNLVFNESKKLVITSGVESLVIVDSPDILLVMNKEKEQELRNVVSDIKSTFKDKFN